MANQAFYYILYVRGVTIPDLWFSAKYERNIASMPIGTRRFFALSASGHVIDFCHTCGIRVGM